jgi:Plasmid encoded RepA protein
MRHAGDKLIRVDKSVALTPKLKRLIETGTTIQLNPGSKDDAVYQHVVLCQVGMPHKRTDVLEFERINGSVSLLLTAGKLRIRGNWVQQPLPYGPKARLIMIHITNYAKRHKTPYVEVGRSTREFLERIGVDDQGSEYRSVKAQLQALAVCRMQLADEWEGRTSQLDAQPIKRFDALIAPDPDQQTLWPQYVELTQDYYESIRRPGAQCHWTRGLLVRCGEVHWNWISTRG